METTATKENKSSGLVAKLARIMSKIDRVPKNGHNDFHNYDYATEADIAEHCRNLLAEEKVMMIPNVLGYEQISKPDKDGKPRNDIVRLNVEFSFYDGDSNDKISFKVVADGEDKGDKATYKAITGAQKYALMKSFLIPTGDDPEDDEEGKKKPTQTKPKQEPKPEPQEQPQQPPPEQPASNKIYRIKSISEPKKSKISGKNYFEVNTTDEEKFWIGEKDEQVLVDTKHSCSENLDVIMLVAKNKRIEKIEPVLGTRKDEDIPF
jgi:hypothetical protein